MKPRGSRDDAAAAVRGRPMGPRQGNALAPSEGRATLDKTAPVLMGLQGQRSEVI